MKKNVLVIFSNNFSKDFIVAQQPTHYMAGNTDSRDVFNDDGSLNDEELTKLQTTDGVQLYHFKHTDPRPPESNQPVCEGEFEWWVEKLLRALQSRGETLDAVAVPTYTSSDNQGVLKFVRDLKQKVPHLKVLIQNPFLSYSDPAEAVEHGRHAWPLRQDAQISNGIDKVTIKRDTPDYALAEGIDVATKILRGIALANALRDMLGMERLQEVKKGRGAA